MIDSHLKGVRERDDFSFSRITGPQRGFSDDSLARFGGGLKWYQGASPERQQA